jgi:ATP-dependent DNA helicase DinG
MRYDRPVRSRDVLGPGSLLSKRFARYEDRPGQVEMAEAVEAALEGQHPLFVEAGTGTGKTLAYLVPAILSGKKVVVSTATKALQEQIVTKDVPLVEEALGISIRVAMMKGLANYVCKRRLAEALASSLVDPSLDRVLAWLAQTESGDRSELDTVSEDDPVWRDVCASTDTRVGAECRYFDECFVTRMRKAAEQASLVIVNHHLLFADLSLRSGRGGDFASAIPKYDAVVFDEAHQIEDIATDFFGSRVSSAQVEALVRDATRAFAGARLGKDGRARSLLEQTQATGQGFFRALGGSGGKEGGLPGRRALEASDYGEAAQAAHGKLDAALEALSAFAESSAASGEAVTLIGRRAGDLRTDLRHIVASAFSGVSRDEDGRGLPCVAWLDAGQRSTSLGSSPIDLGPTLRRTLFDRTPTVVCTSATLATSAGASPASFHFAKARLGAPEETRELIVPSPFDFAGRAVLYLPRDLPEPKDPAFDAAATERVLDLVRVTGGGAFVLCTSNRVMKRIHDGLQGRWKGGVLVQGEAPKHTLLERFREAGDAVLVATMSFWEGVDVPGRALRLVVLDKIPFAVPTDPVVAARSAEIDRQGGSSFAEYSIPAAAITLKQGFGRLLRTQDDAGVVAILDRRIVLRGYGKRLLASLPPARRVALLDDVQAFWDHLEASSAPRAAANDRQTP